VKWVPMLTGLAFCLCVTGSTLGQDDWYGISMSDSVLSFGPVTTAVTESLSLVLTNNLGVTVQVTEMAFEEDIFWTGAGNPLIPPGTGVGVTVYFNSEQNVNFADFLRIELDEGVRPLIVEVSAQAHYPDTYYSNTQNKWAEELKDALTAIIDDHNSVGYTTARDSMYGHIDNVDGWVECVYTGRQAYFNTREGATANNFNCEHTWPQSFSDSNEPMRSDIFHLYPSDVTANSRRANLDFGIVTTATWSNGGSKLGTDSTGQLVFEPRDVHKGNVARSHFYYIIRYDGNYNLYQDPAKMEAHFRSWHVTDPVDGAEEQRNQDIYSLQYNRNPFIDHPELVGRISSLFGTAALEIAPEIAVAPHDVDLGAIEFSTAVAYYVAVANTGNDTLHVSSVTSTDPDFDVDPTSMELAPETYTYVSVTYTSGETELSDSTSVLIVSDDDDEGLVEVPVTVQVSEAAGVDASPDRAQVFRLNQNFPNPFDLTTTVSFELESPAEVDLAIYDVRGRLVSEVLRNFRLPPGKHEVGLAADDLLPGVYYYRLTAGDQACAKRMVVIRRP
jgi:endonuclease I